ncbi:hypothetical protein FHS29_004691 [Saccharothrix tamanrassetensis]|uniref:Uncharacterized protein n=1 Tax=Saccharothrix tamanrassetensis TaxID=1051531 RepID=A0A841CMC0_9PSEU|nr:hypothetical protein [Saccharothrix tamanrassetensis]MBB5958083.1 hypothetical protein [Saccharothrix tamanrassetensis]
MRPAYLEPRTDVPALQDWSTTLILAELRWGARVAGPIAGVSAGVVAWLVVYLPATPGTVAAIVVLGLAALVTAVGPLMHRVETRPVRRGLLDSPWRRCPATVAAPEEGIHDERLLVFGDGGTTVLRGMLSDLTDLVLERQEVFLCGPDGDGRAVVRVAGLCRMQSARVDDRPARPRERAPHLIGRPLDDPAVARAFRYFKIGVRAWVWCAGAAALGVAIAGLSARPLSVAGLVVGGLLVALAALALPTVLRVGGWYREAAAGLSATTRWTPVPVTLFPWGPYEEVAGLAQLPGGTALVRFPLPHLDVIANIADTGTLWIAGGTTGVVAIGVPRVQALTFAVVQPDRDKPDDTSQPWLLRGREPALRNVPALRR